MYSFVKLKFFSGHSGEKQFNLLCWCFVGVAVFVNSGHIEWRQGQVFNNVRDSGRNYYFITSYLLKSYQTTIRWSDRMLERRSLKDCTRILREIEK